jgi:uncharacterized cupin superfamily protein
VLRLAQADPGIRGDFPHVHPTLVETFKCVSGSMVAKVGRTTSEVAEGEKVEVAEGQVHGFLNTGTDQLIIESEVIFPNGYDASLDLMHFAELYDRLKRERPVNKKTDEPPLLQMAVLTHDWRRVIRQPGVAGFVMPILAVTGKLAGYRSKPFDEDSATRT